MKIRGILAVVGAIMALGAAHCRAEMVWATGSSLLEVMDYDLKSHDANTKLTDYQTNAVCLLLGYFRGFAEASAISVHYDATALPYYLPDSITNDEIEHVVYKYLSDNPGKLHMKGDALIVAALTRAFPNPTFKPPSAPKS